MELERVVQSNLTLSDGTIIPVLKVVLSGVNTGDALTFSAAFKTAIIEQAEGFSTTSAYHCSKTVWPDYSSLSSQTIGDDTGFKLSVSFRVIGDINANFTGRLYYKGLNVALFTVWTGYGTYESAPICILVDTNDNLILTSDGFGCPFLLSSTFSGITINNHVVITNILPLSSYDLSKITWAGGNGTATISDNVSGLLPDPDPTPPEEQYPFFLLEQVNKVNNVTGVYEMFSIGTDVYRFGSLTGDNVTCIQAGNNYYFATLSADNTLFEVVYPEGSVIYSKATYTGEDWTEYIIPATETLPEPLTIYYIEYDGVTPIKNAPYYGSADFAQGMFDAYYYLLTGVDPYHEAGAIEHGGGGGTWDLIEDTVTPPSLSPLSSIVGFFNVWKIDKAHLVQLSAFMMGNSLESLWAKTFIDLVDCIISLSILPVSPTTAGNAEITIGGYASGVYSDYVTDQYFVLDCGNLTVPEFYGCYLDYAPYTEIEIYLPYIGSMRLDADTIVGKTINVTYHIDVLTGSCVAFISSDGTILYTFNGCCSQTVPITSEQYGNIAASILTLAGATAAVIATGGAAGAVIAGGVAAAGSALNLSKQSVSKSGHLGGTAGLMAVQYPYLIITRPTVAWSENQNNFTGYPSFITSTIGSLTGYTEFESVHLDGLTCTGDEKAELELLLKGGVIL